MGSIIMKQIDCSVEEKERGVCMMQIANLDPLIQHEIQKTDYGGLSVKATPTTRKDEHLVVVLAGVNYSWKIKERKYTLHTRMFDGELCLDLI